MGGEGRWLSNNSPMPGLIAASSLYDTCIAEFFYFFSIERRVTERWAAISSKVMLGF